MSRARAPVALELPDPGVISLEDRSLLETYRDFYSTLLPGSDGDTIRCDGDFFYFSARDGGIGPEQYPRLRLLSALVRPTKALIRGLNRKVRAWVDLWGDGPGRAETVSNIRQAIREFETFQHAADYSKLTKGSVAARHLDSLDSLFSNAPGMTWLASLDVDTWSRKWAIILYYGDYENDLGTIFPTVLGFALRSGYPKSAGKLLSAEPTYTISAEAEVSGNDLLAACWVRHGDEQSETLGPALLGLDDESLRILSEEYSRLSFPSLFDDVRKAETFADEYLHSEIGGESGLARVFQKFGDIRENGGLKALLGKLDEAQAKLELEEQKAWEAQQLADQLAAKALYDAAPILRPEDLPSETTVDQLTEEQHLSIKKWMQEELGLKNCRIWYGPASKWGRPLGYFYFSVQYEDSGDLRFMTFYEPFPRVIDAFEAVRGER